MGNIRKGIDKDVIRRDPDALLQALRDAGADVIARNEIRCPFHDDQNPSANTYEDGGIWRFKCHGCGWGGDVFDVQAKASGRETKDVLADIAGGDRGTASSPGRRREIAVYRYVNDDGEILHETVRYEPKAFKQRRPDGKGGYIWSLKGIKTTLYRLPELKDFDFDAWVFVAEGEKDVDNLFANGLPATTNPMGAEKWLDEYSELLRGRRIAILADNDRKGLEHALKVVRSLHGIAAEVKIVELPGLPEKGDVSDYLAGVGTAESLLQLVEQVKNWTPDQAASTTNRDAQAVQTLDKHDPLPTARKFVRDRYTRGKATTIRFARDMFYVWGDGPAYREIEAGGLRSQLYEFLETHVRQAKGYGDKATFLPFQPTMSDIRLVTDALKGVTYHDAQPPCWLIGGNDLPDPAQLIVAQNGILDISAEDTTLRPATPELFTTNYLGYPVNLNAPEPTEWMRFLKSILSEDPDAIQLIQEWFGYCLTTVTRFQKILMLIGPPRSGKGTIATVLMHMIGLVNCCGPTLSGLASNFGLQPLLGKQLAVISDARLSGRTDQAIITERLLSISGEDVITVERKNTTSMTGKMPTRITILTNELPRLSDSSGALASRFLVISLQQSFLGHEDLALKERLLGELPSILNWSIQGWRRLRARRHFNQPDAGQRIVDELHDITSPVGVFVREWCNVGPKLNVSVLDLFDGWKLWCAEQGNEKAGTQQVFGRDLRSAVPSVGTSQPRGADGSRFRQFNGISLTLQAAETLRVRRASEQERNGTRWNA